MSGLAIIFLAVGAILGAAIEGEEGFLLGAVVGFLFGAFFNFQKRINQLERLVAKLTGRIDEAALQTPEAETVTQSVPEEKPPEKVQPTKTGSDQAEAVIKGAMPATSRQPVSTADPQTTPSSPPPTSIADDAHYGPGFDMFEKVGERIKTFFTTGNVMVRVGLVVLFFGVGFLLKYAAEHSLVPIELRLAGVAVGGIVMLIIGWRLRQTRTGYALLMQGGAIGVIYLTLFSAFKFYDFIPPTLALVLMLVLVVLSAILAILQDARSLALFGAAGGFLAPVLTSTGGGSHVMLFSYYALLNAGILGIAWHKAWRELNLLGFVFTFVIGSAWGINYYQPHYFASTEPFLILFFLFFVAIAVLFAFRQPPQLKGYVDGTLVFGVPIVAFGLQASLVYRYEYGMAFSALALGAFYIGLASMLWRRNQPGMRMLTEAFLALGVVFASLAIPLALDGRWTAAAWALEGAAMIWIGVRQQRVLARLFGLLLQIGAGIMFLEDATRLHDAMAVFNGLYLGSLAISLAGLFSAYYLQRYAEQLKEWEAQFHKIIFIWGALWWYAAGIHEILEFASYKYEYSLMIMFFSVSSMAAYYLYQKLKWLFMYYPVLTLLPLLLLMLLLQMIGHGVAHPFANMGWLAWPLAFAVHYLQLYLVEKQQPALLNWQHRFAFWLFGFVIAWQLAWSVDWLVEGAGIWSFIMWGMTPALLVLSISAWGERLKWPIKKHYADYFTVIALPLIIGMLLWTVYASLSSAGNPWPLPYVPIVNPLELAELFIFMAFIHWYLKLRRQLQSQPQLWPFDININIPGYILAGIVFVWINGVIARTIHHWHGVRFDWSTMLDSTAFQASISVVWTLFALMIAVFASHKKHRTLWFVGAALLGVVVVKLFLVDLSNSGTIARIVSFLVVGILMLLIGYFSPLPPRRQEETV